jgi:hypothetical protein
MERRSTKHGPQRDDQLKYELQSMERGAPRRPHVEEWREVEPAGDVPVAGRQPPGHHQAAEDIALRSELARVLSRGDFPADRDTLLGRLSEADAPAGLVAWPASRRTGPSQAPMRSWSPSASTSPSAGRAERTQTVHRNTLVTGGCTAR